MPHLLALSLVYMCLPASMCATILQSCECLEQLEIEWVEIFEEPGVVSAPITLPHLHYLRVGSYRGISMWEFILDRVHAPNLVTLDIDVTGVRHDLALALKVEAFVRVLVQSTMLLHYTNYSSFSN